MKVVRFTLFIFHLLSYLLIQEHRADSKIEGLNVYLYQKMLKNFNKQCESVRSAHYDTQSIGNTKNIEGYKIFGKHLRVTVLGRVSPHPCRLFTQLHNIFDHFSY